MREVSIRLRTSILSVVLTALFCGPIFSYPAPMQLGCHLEVLAQKPTSVENTFLPHDRFQLLPGPLHYTWMALYLTSPMNARELYHIADSRNEVERIKIMALMTLHKIAMASIADFGLSRPEVFKQNILMEQLSVELDEIFTNPVFSNLAKDLNRIGQSLKSALLDERVGNAYQEVANVIVSGKKDSKEYFLAKSGFDDVFNRIVKEKIRRDHEKDRAFLIVQYLGILQGD